MTKSVCITGASAGIGAACAREFAKLGWTLILGARRHERLEQLKAQLMSAGAESCHCFNLDVRDTKSVDTFAKQTLEVAHGQLDTLINNAGMAVGIEHLSEGSLEDWQTMIDTNIMGVLRVTRSLLPHLIKQQKGHLIFLSSIAAHQVYEGGGVYCATKHAVRALAKTLKLELNGTPIRITTLDPGMVETEFSVVRRRGNQQEADATYKGMTPLTGEDIAQCAVFAATRPAHFNIDEMILMPTDQATVYKVNRT